jgi:predicted small secreted protein
VSVGFGVSPAFGGESGQAPTYGGEPKVWWGVDGGSFSQEPPMTYLRALTLLAVMAVSACETIEGADRDIGTAGDAIA